MTLPTITRRALPSGKADLALKGSPDANRCTLRRIPGVVQIETT